MEVPKGTRLTGEGILFATDAPVVVPPRSTEYFLDVATGVRAGQQEVTITALEPGEQGNVAAGRVRFFADGALGEKLTVRNPEPLRGGTSVQQTQVTEEDIQRAESACQRQANLKAAEILQAKAGEAGTVLILSRCSWKGELPIGCRSWRGGGDGKGDGPFPSLWAGLPQARAGGAFAAGDGGSAA